MGYRLDAIIIGMVASDSSVGMVASDSSVVNGGFELRRNGGQNRAGRTSSPQATRGISRTSFRSGGDRTRSAICFPATASVRQSVDGWHVHSSAEKCHDIRRLACHMTKVLSISIHWCRPALHRPSGRVAAGAEPRFQPGEIAGGANGIAGGANRGKSRAWSTEQRAGQRNRKWPQS
jgi:hypothetical protein